MLLVAAAEQDPVIRRRRDQHHRGGACRQQRAEVVVSLEARHRPKPRREHQRQQEREQNLHARLRDPNLLQQLDKVAVAALELGLAPVHAKILRQDSHPRATTQLVPTLPHARDIRYISRLRNSRVSRSRGAHTFPVVERREKPALTGRLHLSRGRGLRRTADGGWRLGLDGGWSSKPTIFFVKTTTPSVDRGGGVGSKASTGRPPIQRATRARPRSGRGPKRSRPAGDGPASCFWGGGAAMRYVAIERMRSGPERVLNSSRADPKTLPAGCQP